MYIRETLLTYLRQELARAAFDRDIDRLATLSALIDGLEQLTEPQVRTCSSHAGLTP